MHVHMSLWKDGTNLFLRPQGYALAVGPRRALVHPGGGMIKHAAGGLAGVRGGADDQQAYRRLVPG